MEEEEKKPTDITPPKEDSRIVEMQKQIESLTSERDKFKKERDEANETIRTMDFSKRANEKLEFDEIFGGIK